MGLHEPRPGLRPADIPASRTDAVPCSVLEHKNAELGKMFPKYRGSTCLDFGYNSGGELQLVNVLGDSSSVTQMFDLDIKLDNKFQTMFVSIRCATLSQSTGYDLLKF